MILEAALEIGFPVIFFSLTMQTVAALRSGWNILILRHEIRN